MQVSTKYGYLLFKEVLLEYNLLLLIFSPKRMIQYFFTHIVHMRNRRLTPNYSNVDLCFWEQLFSD